ncbi:polyphosphate kinase 2 [Phaeobacter sp. QD34_3]|uniref:polyphosphate kinase 2 n=1 Tax=unclassified Phaeobacter TaxID=2621772 RepID=UPI00237F7D06|nr:MULTISPECIES: polyphosphate kinase 2 [unclassified Phaeobacter]MDE4131707.1 polyphosphate kinase 2 [Phaeobacter sp. QD34_3]MDE4135204.1 polyphosphate kinase 2 [Phaeobacter sp. QD34_24]
MTLPFDGAISAYYQTGAPDQIRNAIATAKKDDVLDPGYPHDARLKRKRYEADIAALQIELVKLQSWVKSTGARICILFEGRDAAGKGGTIKRFRENLNPRGARVVALSKPTEAEQSQWYFQRYIDHLPSGGEITFFDRSWYNRGVVEHVFGFCDHEQRERFFHQVTSFEEALVEDGIHLFKLWLNVGRAEQLRRFLSRESDPLKQWKLSSIDVKGLARWDQYTDAIGETLSRSHSAIAPWTVVRSDDKRRGRLAAIRAVLHQIDYDNKDPKALGAVDPLICGGPDIWHA